MDAVYYRWQCRIEFYGFLCNLKYMMRRNFFYRKYYKDVGGLHLDVGPYTKAIEFATGLKAELVGKPSPMFFQSALEDMGISANEVNSNFYVKFNLLVKSFTQYCSN